MWWNTAGDRGTGGWSVGWGIGRPIRKVVQCVIFVEKYNYYARG